MIPPFDLSHALTSLGDAAFLLKLPGPPDGIHADALARSLRPRMPSAILDIVPAFDTLAIFYDPSAVPAQMQAQEWLLQVLSEQFSGAHALPDSPLPPLEIPVSYDGPDLASLAALKNMAVESLITLHATAAYTVCAIGFMPGFAYLGGLPACLHSPRRESPRRRVPAGSVAIGGPYTGIYPFSSPGGWHLIGHTECRLFNTEAARPALLTVGQEVRFIPRGAAR